MIGPGEETWVSATQNTNGVAGGTIQQGENLTLRLFNTDVLDNGNPGATELTNPTGTTDGIAIKFDGIGSNEDLIINLDLIDPITHQEITRSVVVDDSDIIKGNVPAPRIRNSPSTTTTVS